MFKFSLKSLISSAYRTLVSVCRPNLAYLSVLGLFSNVLLGVHAHAQTLTPSIDNVVPPAPNASAIAKFGNIPVGQSTGIPSISVPIYSWKGANFDAGLNVSLAYHNGGVRVDETASNIGLGWALNAGGVISRTMRGTYDEVYENGFIYRAPPSSAYEGNTWGVANSDRTFSQMNAGNIDTQCDIFNYNFNGRSGRFVLGRNNDLLLLDQAKLKVEKFLVNFNGSQLLGKFIITDESGYRYVFEDCEFTSQLPAGRPNALYTSSWYLTKVLNPAGNVSMDFQYETVSFYSSSKGPSTIAQPLVGDGSTLYADLSGGSTVAITGKRLQRISLPDGNILDFSYDQNQRSDLAGDYLLKKIKISKGTLANGYLLNHDYSLWGRATLLNVVPFGGHEEVLDKPYVFDYYTDATLPAQFTNAQDHWGYANFNTGAFLPHEYVMAPGGQYNPWREFTGGNRDTHEERVKAGSMRKMTYPTGGFTVFEMEANTAKDNWLEQNEQVTITNPPYADIPYSMQVNSDNTGMMDFLFEGENNTQTSFEISVNPLAGSCNGGCYILFDFYNASNTLIYSQQINFSDYSPDPYKITKTFTINNLIKNQTYTIRAQTANLSGYYEYAEVNRREVRQGSSSTVTLSHVQEFVGGLRAKKVIDYTGINTTPATTKEYAYVMEDGITSSGALGHRPKYTYLVKYDYKNDPTLFEQPSYSGNSAYNYAIRSSNPVSDMTYVNGSPVTYRRVVEKIIANGQSLGSTVRYFTGFHDYPITIHDVFPSIPNSYSPWSYGLLKQEDVYDAMGKLLKRTENTYSGKVDTYINDPQRVENFRSIAIAPVKFQWNGSVATPAVDPSGVPHYFLMSSFTPVAGRNELVQTQVTDYQDNQPPISVTNANEYDQDMYYLRSKKVWNSEGKELKTTYGYPKDYLADPVFNAMYQSHIFSPIVTEKSWKNEVYLAGQRKSYANWQTGVYEPQYVFTEKAGEAEEQRIEHLAYDAQGALTAVKTSQGVPSCYIWGYGGQHLVAKINNADYATVQSVIGSTTLANFAVNKAPTDAEVNALVAQLRSGLPQASIESFTLNTLRGVTSQTDSNGKVTYYEYDLFGRLLHLKDQDGHLLKQYTYHYKN